MDGDDPMKIVIECTHEEACMITRVILKHQMHLNGILKDKLMISKPAAKEMQRTIERIRLITDQLKKQIFRDGER